MTARRTNSSIDTIAGECIAMRMRLLNRVVTNLYDDALRPLGLKVSQMNILVAASTMGVARPAEVCRQLHLEMSTLSRNVERMKARGWLEVVADDDGRAQPFRLTGAGRKLLAKAVPAWHKAQRRAKILLGDKMLDVLRQAIQRLQH